MAANQVIGGSGLTSNPGLIDRERNDQLLQQALENAQREKEFQARYALEQQQMAAQAEARQQQMALAQQENAYRANESALNRAMEQAKFDYAKEQAKQDRMSLAEKMAYESAQAQAEREDARNKSALENAFKMADLDIKRAGLEGREWKPQTIQEALEYERARRETKPPTQGQETTALYASRIKQANDVMESLTPYINKLPVIGTAVNERLPNFLKDERYQSYDQAKRNFLNAVLRRESGAVISPSEFDSADKQYFPQVGDRPEVIEQKRQNRDLVMRNFIASARDAYVPYEANVSSGSLNITAEDEAEYRRMRGI